MLRLVRPVVLLALFPVLYVAPGSLGQASFEGLGDLPGGSFSSGARDVSPDWTIVVGASSSELGGEAFLWTASEGMLGLVPCLQHLT